jgi:hypothetical protein
MRDFGGEGVREGDGLITDSHPACHAIGNDIVGHLRRMLAGTGLGRLVGCIPCQWGRHLGCSGLRSRGAAH